MTRVTEVTETKPAKPVKPGPAWEWAIVRLFIESPADVLNVLRGHRATKAFTDAAAQAVINAGIRAYRDGEPFDAPRAIEAASTAGFVTETLGVIRRVLMEPGHEPDDLTACVQRLVRNRDAIELVALQQRIARETDPGLRERLALEAARIIASLEGTRGSQT